MRSIFRMPSDDVAGDAERRVPILKKRGGTVMRKEKYDIFIAKNGRTQNVRGYRGRRKRKWNLYGILFLVAEIVVIGGMTAGFFLQKQSDRKASGVETADIWHDSVNKTGMGGDSGMEADISASGTGMAGDFGVEADSFTDSGTGGAKSSDLSDEEVATIKSGDKWKKIFENEHEYPVDLINALKRNPEICDFAAGYLTADMEAAGGITSEESREECPLFLQWDKRWGYVPYGRSNIGISGCGPSCLSMVLYSLTRDESLTPDALAEQAMNGGYYVAGQGTKWSFMEDIAPQYGVFVFQETIWDRSQLELYLDDEKLIICDMGPGDFTDTGHFIVIRGYSNGKFFVNDPFSRANSDKAWDYDVIASQCRQIWVYALVEKSNTPQQATGHDLACSFRPKGRGICLRSASVLAIQAPLALSNLAAFAKYPRKRGCLAHCSRE